MFLFSFKKTLDKSDVDRDHLPADQLAINLLGREYLRDIIKSCG